MTIAERRPYDIDSLTGVALRVFAERGYDGASMDDVARAAGITKAAIYHHVAGKEALLERGLDRALGALFTILNEPGAVRGPAIGRLRYVVRRVAELALRLVPELTVLVRVRGNSEAERRALEKRRTFDARTASLVREAQLEGDLDATIDPALYARIVLGACNSLVEWYRSDGSLTPETIADALVRIVLAPRS